MGATPMLLMTQVGIFFINCGTLVMLINIIIGKHERKISQNLKKGTLALAEPA